MRTACSSTTIPTACSTASPPGAPRRRRAPGCGSTKRSALLAALALTAGTAVAAPPPLMTGMGTNHFPVTCSAKAQAYVDQGMAMVYGFNHDEAIRAFEEAARL